MAALVKRFLLVLQSAPVKEIVIMNYQIVRLRTIKEWTGLSRSTIYLMMKTGSFPKSISLGARSVGWLESDIQAWFDSCVTARDAARAVQSCQ